MVTTNENAWEPYIAGWQRRLQQGREAQRRRQVQALEDARRIAAFLAERYRVRRVILFGSLATGRFRLQSDIDLAVEGLEKSRYIRAWVEIDELSDVPVDLKPLEDCHGFVRQRIEKDGVVLYES